MNTIFQRPLPGVGRRTFPFYLYKVELVFVVCDREDGKYAAESVLKEKMVLVHSQALISTNMAFILDPSPRLRLLTPSRCTIGFQAPPRSQLLHLHSATHSDACLLSIANLLLPHTLQTLFIVKVNLRQTSSFLCLCYLKIISTLLFKHFILHWGTVD